MFLRQIEDFERTFKILDRINILVFNVWRDKNAEAFKDGEMKLLESFYRTYISEMREKSNEMLQLKQSIDREIEEMQDSYRKLEDISHNPSYKGCGLYRASGPINSKMHEYGTDAFVAKLGEDAEKLASFRCSKLESIDSVSLERVL